MRRTLPRIARWFFAPLRAAAAGDSSSDSLLDGLVAWYRNDGTDHSGNGNDLTPSGTPSTTAGIGGAANAAMLLEMGDTFSRAPLITSGSFSISLWFLFPGGAVPDMDFLQQYDGITMRQGMGGISATGDMFGAVNTTKRRTFTAVADPGTVFHHLVLTYNGVKTKVYYHGSLETNPNDTANFTSLDAFFLTAGVLGDSVALQYIGVWNRELTPTDITIVPSGVGAGSEIGRLFNSGAGFDPTA